MAKWNRIYHQKFEAYRNEDGDIVYQFNEGSKYEVVLFPVHGLRQKLYYGNSERVANNWLNKIIGDIDEQAKYGKDYDDWKESKIAEEREG